MRSRSRTLLAVAVLCLLVAGVVAQETQQPIFRTAVSRVRVDVVVTDDDGAFVDDLAAEDFRVFEDGEPVELVDVQLVDLGAGSVDSLGRDAGAAGDGDVAAEEAGAEGGAAAAAGDAPAPPSPAPTTDAVADLGAMVYVIDGPSLMPQTKARFADAWADILERTASLSIPKAVYFVDNSGRLRELTPMTREASRLRDAAEAVAEEPLTTGNRGARLVEIARDLSGTGASDPGGGGAGLIEDPGRRIAAQKVREFEADETDRSLATYQLLSAVCDALWARPGRTALVWVSSGIKLMTGGPFRALLSTADDGGEIPTGGLLPTDNVSPDPRIRQAQEAFHRAANSANVSVYSVDPALVNETRSLGYDASFQSGAVAAMLQSPVVLQSLDALDDALLHASEETGGRAFLRASEIGEVLEEIDEHSSRFYLLTYLPPPPDGDGAYHEIRVEVDREDVDVQARRGYVDTPAEERSRRSVNAALQLTGTATGLPVEATTYTSWKEDGAVVLLAVSVDPSRVGVYVDGEGRRMSDVEFHTVVAEGDEVIEEAHQGIRVERPAGSGSAASDAVGAGAPPQAGEVQKTGAAQEAGEPQGGGQPQPGGPPGAAGPGASPPEEIVYRREFELEPGVDYELRVAVLDPVSDRIGATRVEVPIPERPEGWHTSDAVLVVVEPSGTLRPVVGGKARRGREVTAYVEVYGGQQPILRGQVFDAEATEETAQHAELFAMPLQRVGPDTHRGAIPLPTTLPPGSYVVQLQVTDAAAGEHRVLRTSFQVIDGGSR